jgi:F-type H+-transporting ATPase subunit alpha
MLNEVPINKIKAFEEEFIRVMNEKQAETMAALGAGKYTDAEMKVLDATVAEVIKGYKA